MIPQTPTLILPYSFAKHHKALVGMLDDQSVEIIHTGALPPHILLEMRRALGTPPTYRTVTQEEFASLFSRTYETNAAESNKIIEAAGEDIDLAHLGESLPEQEDLLAQGSDAPIIRLINVLLLKAVQQRASDIHIESFEKHLVVRFRIDGMLQEVTRLRPELAVLMVSRIKVMAKLDIAEKRIPQDGHISLRIIDKEHDVRVSTIPSSSGERVVLRLLDKQVHQLDLDQLGMSLRDLITLNKIIHRPHGVILVTGPTGSGKTTTLYAALTQLNDGSRSILTIEDPVEFLIDGIGQTPVNTKTDMTFARGLRAILRQDPDVIMVGEIRDTETASIAIQASLTGHLVLSTLHTNTAVGTITRLYDMGVEPFLLSSSLAGLVSQRLVRKLCPHCKIKHTAGKWELDFLQTVPKFDLPLYKPKGCEQCSGLGFKGRAGIYEVVPINDAMRQLIHSKADEQQIEAMARTLSPSILDNAREKIIEGITTIEEVLRVIE